MSQENMEFVKGLWAAGESMDKQALLAALPDLIAQTCDPEIEWVEDPQRADARVYRGHHGVREPWQRWLENFDEWGFELESVTDHGNRVLVVSVERGCGSGSEAEVSARNYDEAQALEAVGPTA